MRVDLGGIGRGGEWVTVNNDGGTVRAAPDIVADITAHAAELERHFAFGSVDEIRCIHTLEHLPAWDVLPTLAYWRKFLKPGGKLHIVVPDLGQMARDYAMSRIPFDVFASVAYVPGVRTKDKPAGEEHRWAWDVDTLTRDLEQVGYRVVDDYPDYPASWLLDFENLEHTGLLGKYQVPNLKLTAINKPLFKHLAADIKQACVSIFILHYNRDNFTEECIASVMADYYAGAQVTVIDNGSRKPFESKYPVQVVRLPETLPMMDAFNHVACQYPSDVYVYLTNDTRMGEGSLQRLVDTLADKRVGIVAPGTNDRGAGILYVGDAPNPDLPSVETKHVDNTCWAFTQDTVDKIGLPTAAGHTHWGCWASNQEYAWRARGAGLKVMAVRGAWLWHSHDGGQDAEADSAGTEWLRMRLGVRFEEAR